MCEDCECSEYRVDRQPKKQYYVDGYSTKSREYGVETIASYYSADEAVRFAKSYPLAVAVYRYGHLPSTVEYFWKSPTLA